MADVTCYKTIIDDIAANYIPYGSEGVLKEAGEEAMDMAQSGGCFGILSD